MRQTPLALSGAFLLASLPGSILSGEANAQEKNESKRLNIIHIMTDDHAFQAISAYGHPLSQQAPTPNMDRLAREGIRFDRAYVENSLSTPSRACLMTGLYSHQNGQRTLGKGIDTTKVFVSELLRDAGYQTAMIGKWHMQCEPKGFDYFYVFRGQGEYYNPVLKSHLSDGEYVREEGYATDLVTSHALEFLEQRDPDKPFCLYVHHKAPHRNWMPNVKYLDLYEDVTFPLPETFHDDYSGKGEAAFEQRMTIDEDMSMIYDLKVGELEEEPTRSIHTARMLESGLSRMDPETRAKWDAAYGPKNKAFLDSDLEGEALLEWKFQRYVKDYLRVIRSVDDSVGEILEYLDSHGLADNTIVVYTSDQGFYMGEHGWFDKRFMYEESYRTPLIIRYPGGKGGLVSETLVQNIDFAPTYLDVAGAAQPEEMSGHSLLPVIMKDGGTPRGWRKYLYYHYYDLPSEHNVLKHDGVSDKRFKLIHFYGGAKGDYSEFYDIKKDPTEMNNLYGEKRYKRRIARLQKQLDKFRAELAVDEYSSDLDIKYAKDLLAKGTPAPGFTLKTPDGKDVSLSDFRGKYVVLDFWASWCPDCRKDAPQVKALWEKYGEKVAFVGVSFDTDKDKWTDYINENGLGWTHVSPLAKWKETQVSQDYKVNWIPSMYLINPKGKVVFGTVMIDKLAKELEAVAGK